jgi:hypothetical protein
MNNKVDIKKTLEACQTELRSTARGINGNISPYAKDQIEELVTEVEGAILQVGKPIDMLLFCPRCDIKHIDQPEPAKGWTNPPHRTHKCQRCGWEWRPADVATNGVAALSSRRLHDEASPYWAKTRPINFGKAKT